MKKAVIYCVGAALLLSGCGTHTGSGACTGATFGSILGSAIGGINGGPRGSDIGTIVGMAGGAVVGGVIGAQADKAQQEKYEDYKRDSRRYDVTSGCDRGYDGAATDDSGFDPSGGGDDVLYDYDIAPAADTVPTMKIGHSGRMYAREGTLEIRNLRFVDDGNDNVISGGEICKVVFEVYNNSSSAYYNIRPVVEETTGNKRIYISESVRVEKIMPGRGIRYTAMVKADKRIKDGVVKFRIYAAKDDDAVTDTIDFSVPTEKRR